MKCVKLIAAGHIEKIDRNRRERPLKGCQRDRKEIVKQVCDVANIERGQFVATEVPHGLNNLLAEFKHAFCIDQE